MNVSTAKNLNVESDTKKEQTNMDEKSFELNDLIIALEKKQSELQKRLKAIQEDKTRRSGPLDASIDEQTLEQENFESLDAIENVELNELKNINKALEKVKNGGFGICEEYGEQISLKRLKVLPQASLCITQASLCIKCAQ